MTRMLSRLAIVLLLGTYLYNLHLERPFRCKTEKVGQNATFFDESEADLATHYELDFIRDSIIQPFAFHYSVYFFPEATEKGAFIPRKFSSIYLEILIPPPRKSSFIPAVS